jgi:hypothetical protein
MRAVTAAAQEVSAALEGDLSSAMELVDAGWAPWAVVGVFGVLRSHAISRVLRQAVNVRQSTGCCHCCCQEAPVLRQKQHAQQKPCGFNSGTRAPTRDRSPPRRARSVGTQGSAPLACGRVHVVGNRWVRHAATSRSELRPLSPKMLARVCKVQR